MVGEGKDAGVFDLGKRYGKKYPTLRAAIVDGALKTLAKAAQGKKPDHKLSRIKYLPVLPDARKIVCVGLNYHEHREETGRPTTAQSHLVHPLGRHSGWPRAAGPEAEGIGDGWTGKASWWSSSARPAAASPRQKAMSHVAGYSIYNDVSIRDWQRHTSQFTPGKNFVGTGPFGPWLVTPDELPEHRQPDADHARQRRGEAAGARSTPADRREHLLVLVAGVGRLALERAGVGAVLLVAHDDDEQLRVGAHEALVRAAEPFERHRRLERVHGGLEALLLVGAARADGRAGGELGLVVVGGREVGGLPFSTPRAVSP